MHVAFVVNGRPTELSTAPMKRLLDLLRDDIGLTGTKEGCGEGECGACTVMIDGLLALSCIVPACQIDGKHILTIEGLAARSSLHPVQRAFQENSGSQCGMCTPGMIVAAVYYLNHSEEVEHAREALAGNQCRCTGYVGILKSIAAVLEK